MAEVARCAHSVPAASISAVGEYAHRYGSEPPAQTMYRNGSAGIVDLCDTLKEENAEIYQNSSENANDYSRGRRHKGARGRDCDQPRQHSIAGHGHIGFAEDEIPQNHGCRRTRHGSQVGIHGDHGDSQVCCPKGRARVETHPSKQKDECARHYVDEVVSGKGTRLAILSIFTESGAQNDGESHGAKSADSMNDGRT